MGLHILVVFWQPNPSWGVDFLFYMPVPIQGLFILLAVLLFIPSLRRRIRSWVRALPFALWGQSRRVWVTRTLALILALGVCAAGVFTKGEMCLCWVRCYVGSGMMSFGRGHHGSQAC